jgi:hypothetical protein
VVRTPRSREAQFLPRASAARSMALEMQYRLQEQQQQQ